MGYLYEVVERSAPSAPAWPVSERESRRFVGALLELVRPALARAADLAGVAPPADPAAVLQDFMALYPERPFAENKGGSGLNDSLWLYLLARTIQPSLLIESGTWRGQSAWLFYWACPQASLHSFDIEVPDGGRHQTAAVTYHLTDWTAANLRPPAEGPALIFFDDHVSHAQRLAEAADRGFRLALLDDNFAAHQLHATGAPPVPTLAMLSDTGLAPEGVIEWRRNGKLYRYHDTLERRQATERRVEAQLVLPELAPVTRHPPGSGLTLVRLR